jgi:hypothetical protein
MPNLELEDTIHWKSWSFLPHRRIQTRAHLAFQQEDTYPLLHLQPF